MIEEFDTYIFDFDGVVVDSERFHWLSYETDVSFEKYCTINHGLEGPYFRDTMDAAKKDENFIGYIKDIPLKEGFKEFYDKLVSRKKKVFIVTNTSRKIYDLFSEKFPFLKDIPIVTDCKKPDPSGYASVPCTGRTIVFEDSYRGFYAARQVFTHVVLVNSLDYVYRTFCFIKTFSEL